MSRIRSRNNRRLHFHSYNRGIRNHWSPRTGGVNVGTRGFRHTHDGRRHGHQFREWDGGQTAQHWGRYPGGYSQHHEGYYHSHNTPRSTYRGVTGNMGGTPTPSRRRHLRGKRRRTRPVRRGY